MFHLVSCRDSFRDELRRPKFDFSYSLNFSLNFMSYILIAMSSSDDKEYGSFSNCCFRIFIAQVTNLFNSPLFIKITTT